MFALRWDGSDPIHKYKGSIREERRGVPIAFPPHRTPIPSRLAGAPCIVVTGGWSGHGIALGVRVGQLIADALVDGAPLPSWGVLPDASAD
jgi:glycine/D-amino acid oxidase-like deaminating enzyme